MTTSKETEVLAEYDAGHSYNEVWEFTNYHCPQCSRVSVFTAPAQSDYYAGEPFACASCGFYWNMPYTRDMAESKALDDKTRYKQLKRYYSDDIL